jgi:hypothetical protein
MTRFHIKDFCGTFGRPASVRDGSARWLGRILLAGAVVTFASLIFTALPVSAQTARHGPATPSLESRSPRTGTAKSSAKAADKTVACPEYGAGFVRLEGTSTCIKMNGSIDIGTGGRIGHTN